MGDLRNEQGDDGKVRRLSDAVRRVRLAEAERTDAFADLHEADRARLTLLGDELAAVFAELPDDDDYFIGQIAGATPPRLWIDPTTHVVIGRDRRTYRFLKDTRLGRVVLAETADVADMADRVTDYVAARVVDRERAVETDSLMARLADVAAPAESARPAPAAAGVAGSTASERPGSAVWTAVAFLFGVAVGALGLIGYALVTVPG